MSVRSSKQAITASDARAQSRLTARERERDARRRYQAAITAARDLLRRAQTRFDESSAAIDLHIERARAALAASTRFSLQGATHTGPHPLAGSATRRIRSSRPSSWARQAGAETEPAGKRRSLSPAPSRLFP